VRLYLFTADTYTFTVANLQYKTYFLESVIIWLSFHLTVYILRYILRRICKTL